MLACFWWDGGCGGCSDERVGDIVEQAKKRIVGEFHDQPFNGIAVYIFKRDDKPDGLVVAGNDVRWETGHGHKRSNQSGFL